MAGIDLAAILEKDVKDLTPEERQAALDALDQMDREDAAAAQAAQQPQGPQDEGAMMGTESEAPEGGLGFDDVADGIYDMGKGVVRGALGAVQETADFAGGVGAWLDRNTGGEIKFDTGNETANKVLTAVGRPLDTISDIFGGAKDALPETDTMAGGMTEGVAQFAFGWLGAGKFKKAANIPNLFDKGARWAQSHGSKLAALVGDKTARWVGAMTQGAVVDAVVFDGNDERLSNLIQSFPELDNPITEFLAAKPEDSEAEGRFKNAIEGLLIGPVADGAVYLVEGFTKLMKARKLRAAGDEKGADAVEAEAAEQFRQYDNAAEAPSGFGAAEAANQPRFDADPAPTATPKVPDANFVRDVADGSARLPSPDELRATIDAIKKNDDDIMLGDGWSPEDLKRYKELRAIERGGGLRADEASAEIRELNKKYPTDSSTDNVADIEELRVMLNEFEALKRGDETTEQYADGLARVAARYVMDARDGDPLSTAILRQVFSLAKENGVDTKVLSQDTISKFAKDLSDGDKAFVADLFKRVQEAPAPKAVEAPKLAFPERPKDIPADWKEFRAEDGKPLGWQSPDGATVRAIAQEPPAPTLPKTPGPQRPDVQPIDFGKAQKAISARYAAAGKDADEVPFTASDLNIRMWSSEGDARAAIHAVAAAQQEALEASRGGMAPRPDAQVSKLADSMGVNPVHVMEWAGRDADWAFSLDARIRATNDLMNVVAADATAKADRALSMIGNPKYSDADIAKAKAEAFHSVQIMSSLMQDVRSVRASVGRALRQAGKASAKNRSFIDYETMAAQLQTGTGVGDLRALKAIKASGGNVKALRKQLEGGVFKRGMDSFHEFYINSILSGPPTHVVNVVSNTLNTLFLPLERAYAASMGRGLGYAGRQLAAEYGGMGLALLDSVKIAATALKSGEARLDVRQGGKAVETRPSRAISARNWGLAKDMFDAQGNKIGTRFTPVLGHLVEGLGQVINIPQRLLTTQDEFFKQINYRAHLYSQAYMEARALGDQWVREAEAKRGSRLSAKEAATLVDAATKAHIADSFTKGFDANGVGKNAEGIRRAREATFMEELDPRRMSAGLQKLVDKVPFGRTILPFIRTPQNIIDFVWERTPLVNLAQLEAREALAPWFKYQKDVMLGRNPPPLKAEVAERAHREYAKMVTGSLLWSAAAFLAESGAVTGAGPLNPTLRQAREKAGWQPNSIRWLAPDGTEKFLSFNRMDPIGLFLGMAADYTDARRIDPDSGEAESISGAMLVALSRAMQDKTYVQGLMNVVNAVSDSMSGRDDKALERFAYKWSAPAVPSASNAFKYDSHLREVNSVLDAWKNRLPGYSAELRPVRDFAGEIVHTPTKLMADGAPGLSAISPVAYKAKEVDYHAQELSRLMELNEKPFIRMDPKLLGTEIDLREVTLANGQNAYDRTQEILTEIDGGLMQNLRDLIDSDDYTNATDGDSEYPGSRMGMVSEMIASFRKEAKAQLLDENPELDWMLENEQGRREYNLDLGSSKRDMPRAQDGEAYQMMEFLDSLSSSGRRKNDLRLQAQ